MPRNRSMRLAALGSTVQRAASPAYPSSRAAGALRRRLVAAILVVVSLAMLTLYFREADSGPMHSVQGAVASVLHPFQVGAERVARPFRDAYGWTAGLVHARSENERLREDLQRLRLQAIQNQSAAQENVDLRKALSYISGATFPQDYDGLVASVTSYATGEWEQSLVISAGGRNGVGLDDPVVSSDGYLVGQVTKVTRSSAEVTLLTDSTSSVTARDAATGTLGVLEIGEGPDRPFELNRVPKERVVREGDTIVTAGRRFGRLGSMFPRNIPIGSVKGVNQVDIENFQQIQVDPFADFSSLDTLVVLVPKEQQVRTP
ncbi:MAG TPA: rod shape-determining protein MreC [Gaiellaceae bacterium]